MPIFRRAALAALLSLIPVAALAGSVDPDLASAIAGARPGEKFPVLVRFARAPAPTARMGREAARAANLVRRAAHEKTAASVGKVISDGGGKVGRSLWSVGMIAAELEGPAIGALASLGEVSRISADRIIRRRAVPASALPQAAGYHFDAVNAGVLWELGHKGAGARVAVFDSGVDMNHSAFTGANWAGLPAGWFDPYGEVATPNDDPAAHGTKVLSLIVGKSADFSLGLAPEAEWMAGRIYDNTGEGRLSAIHAVFQWALDPDGDPVTDDAPDAVCNSWGFELDRGICDREFQEDIDLLAEAGILVVFAAGNSGPETGSDISPANNSNVFSVGAVSSNGGVASFSARGPNSCSGATYPDAAAPGVSVTVADYTNGGIFPDAVETVNGTSFSAPIAVGAALLLKSAWPELTMEEIGNALRQSARDTGAPGVDNDTGHGAIDVAAAHRLLAGCADGDGDGYFTGGEECGAVDCDDSNPRIHPGACDEPKDGVDQDCSGGDATSGPPCKTSSGSPSLLPGGCFILPRYIQPSTK